MAPGQNEFDTPGLDSQKTFLVQAELSTGTGYLGRLWDFPHWRLFRTGYVKHGQICFSYINNNIC